MFSCASAKLDLPPFAWQYACSASLVSWQKPCHIRLRTALPVLIQAGTIPAVEHRVIHAAVEQAGVLSVAAQALHRRPQGNIAPSSLHLVHTAASSTGLRTARERRTTLRSSSTNKGIDPSPSQATHWPNEMGEVPKSACRVGK